MTRKLLGAFVAALAVSAAGRGADAPPKPPAPPAHPGLDRIKSMVGTWVEADKDGKPTDKVFSVVKLTAGGSAVHETTFPGQPMEMMSVYHLDGNDLVMTHYCVLGNQPRMKADPKAPANQVKFDFAGGSNLDPAKDMHMHGATLTFTDADHVTISGIAWAGGKICEEHCTPMKIVRKK
ncbi:MAG: hypothetical protein ACRC7O_02425 [Fimbriiglobus sp.]